MLHRTESCSPFTSNTVIWPLFMIQYWFVRLQSCDLWERPEFEGSFKTVWGQHIHLLLITPFIATFGCSLTFIKELRCSCTLDWDWTQPLRPTVWRHRRGHIRELWPGPRVRVWDDMAGGDRRDKRRQRSRVEKKKKPRRIWIYSNCISHVYLVTTLWIEMIHSWIMRIDLGIKKVIVGSDFTVHRQCHRSGVALMDDRPPQCCTTTGVGERSQSQWNDSAALQELHIILPSL